MYLQTTQQYLKNRLEQKRKEEMLDLIKWVGIYLIVCLFLAGVLPLYYYLNF